MFATEKRQTLPKRFKELVRRQASVQRTEEAPMGLVRLDLECAVRSVLFLHSFILFFHTLFPLSSFACCPGAAAQPQRLAQV